MSDLTEALDRILNALPQKPWSEFPGIEYDSSLLQPGLTHAEIEEIVKDLPIRLPDEIYELYQWRNGSQTGSRWQYAGLFDIYHSFSGFGPWGFLNLQFVVDEYLKRKKYAVTDPEILNQLSAFKRLSGFQNPTSLEIFCGIESCDTGYVAFHEGCKSIQVVCYNYKGGSHTVIAEYASLTDMMVTLAECYETAYYREANGDLAKDTNKVWEIWRKYNSEPLVKAALKKIEQAEPILPQLDGNTSSYLLHEVGDILNFSQDERLIAPLIRVLRRPPTNNRADENENLDYLRGTASMLLGWLGGTNAVQPVIEALKDEYWLTRYWAAITLGELKDHRAIFPLTELLQDSQEMIRQAAGEALIKISQKDAPINPLYSNPAVANMEAAGALIGMTLEDVWPTMTIIKELENSGNVGDEGSSSGSIDDDLDDIPF